MSEATTPSRVEIERDAWEETAKQAQTNCDYYKSLVVKIGEMLGREAYVADDGTKQTDVLCAKVPQLVAARLGANIRAGCYRPPEGWYCTRSRGHEGPCAAHEDK